MEKEPLFGDFVRRQRLQKGFTLRKFCKEVDLSCSFVSCMERNEASPPTEENIVNIAKVLSIDPDYLILLAKRVPVSVQKMMFERPKLVAFLRKANNKSDDELERLPGFNESENDQFCF